jgi:hypothetical protein
VSTPSWITSLLTPVISPTGHQDLLPATSTTIANKFLHSVARQLPSSQAKQDDIMLNGAHEIVQEFESVIAPNKCLLIKEIIE